MSHVGRAGEIGPSRHPVGEENSGGGGGGVNTHRLREVHVAFGGRIRACWEAVLSATPCYRAAGGGRSHGEGCGGDGRPPCGYSWAIVRTRGVVGECGWAPGRDSHVSNNGAPLPSSCVVKQGVVGLSPLPADGAVKTTARTQMQPSWAGRAGASPTDGEGSNGKDKNVRDEDNGATAGGPSFQPYGASSVSPTPSNALYSLSPPWRWQRFEADTTGWLPGDLLSLWIQVWPYQVSNPPVPVVGAAEVDQDGEVLPFRRRMGTTSVSKEHDGGGGAGGRSAASSFPRVRGFELRVVDDARANEAAGRACLRRRHPSLNRALLVSQSTTKGSRGAGAGARDVGSAGGGAMYAATASATTVRLDFATVCPMNLAAAGGSWA